MHHDQPLSPATKQAIETIAQNLRNLPCANSLVAMNLHRVARDLEAIAADHAGTSEAFDAHGGGSVRLETGVDDMPTPWSAQERCE